MNAPVAIAAVDAETPLERSDVGTTVSSSDQAGELGIPTRESLDGFEPLIAFYRQVPIQFARRHGIAVATSMDSGTTCFLCADLNSWHHLANLSKLLERPLQPVLAPAEVICTFNNSAYESLPADAAALLSADEDVGTIIEDLSRAEGQDLLDGSSQSPVVRLVNHLLTEAIKAQASDVHVQPTEEALLSRYRIDGTLYDHLSLPKHVQEELVSRVKVLARMNIAEKRLPQDGRATVELGDRVIDLRISTVPTSFGERLVIRLLDKSARLYRLPELGMTPDLLKRFRQLIRLEHGLILVTGPTGSGKSTTLYAALQELDAREHNILTIEDPIEYRLEGISQMQVSEKKGMTFASGLRSILRQDPDVIMVGEIRDHETASIAIQSALTGHLVFSTLHTNDAASAVTRLIDLGVEPYLLASCLAGVLAQRLVRTACSQCGVIRPLEADEQVFVRGTTPLSEQRVGTGCARCRNSGYRGRLGIFELLLCDPVIQQLIHSRATAGSLRQQAMQRGMVVMREDGFNKVRTRQTTLSEIMRVSGGIVFDD